MSNEATQCPNRNPKADNVVVEYPSAVQRGATIAITAIPASYRPIAPQSMVTNFAVA